MQRAPWSDPNILLAEFREGNQIAFKHIYDLHNKSLWLVAYKILSDTAEAEDVVAESFTKLWQKRDTFQSGSNIRAWMGTVVTRAAIDLLKKKRSNLLSENQVKYLTDIQEDVNYIDASQIQAELFEKALALMDTMPKAMRQIFRLHYVEELKSQEIAEKLGLSVDTVRVQKGRALKLLKNAFNVKDPP